MKYVTGRLSILYLVLATAFVSCSKKSDGDAGGDDYIKFKADGKQVEYRQLTQSQISYSASAGFYMCIVLGGKEASAPSKNIISINIYGLTNFEQGVTYDLVDKLVLPGGGTTTKGTLSYIDDSGAGYVAQGPQRISSTADMEAHVTITSLTTDHLKGTFTAVAYKATDFSKKIAITEGEFSLKRVN